MKQIVLLTVGLIMAAASSYAQEMPEKEEKKSNVQTYTPSVLLKKGQVELKYFNNIYSQDHWFNEDGEKTPLAQRQTFYGGQFSGLFGTSASARVNVGFDFSIKGVHYDSDSAASPFKVLRFESSDTSRMVLSSFGPKIKISPFKRLTHFSIQSAFWIPLAPNLEQNPWLDYNRYIWWNQFFYDHSFLNGKVQIFTEVDLLFRIAKDRSKAHQLTTPVSFFTSYFPTSKSTVYGMIQVSPLFQEEAQENADGSTTFLHQTDSKIVGAGYFAQAGFGSKYQLTPTFELEVLYTNFFAGDSQGAGYTINLGMRWLY